MSRSLSAALVLLLGLAGPAAAFLSPAGYDPKLILPPPPAEGSAAAQAELAELDRVQAGRSDADFARADQDFRTRNASIFAAAIGPGFVLSALPATAKMLDDVQKEEDAAAGVAKSYFGRTRPWIVDPALNPCSKMEGPQSAYPSGHSTMGYALGVVLASLLPARAPAIMARAADYAENRLVCGMHRRRDIEAGQVLGTVVAERLLEEPKFQAEYEAAKAELSAAAVGQ